MMFPVRYLHSLGSPLIRALQRLLSRCYRSMRSFRFLWVTLWRHFRLGVNWPPAQVTSQGPPDDSCWIACLSVHSSLLVTIPGEVELQNVIVTPRNHEEEGTHLNPSTSGFANLTNSPIQSKSASEGLHHGHAQPPLMPKGILVPMMPASIDRYETKIVVYVDEASLSP